MEIHRIKRKADSLYEGFRTEFALPMTSDVTGNNPESQSSKSINAAVTLQTADVRPRLSPEAALSRSRKRKIDAEDNSHALLAKHPKQGADGYEQNFSRSTLSFNTKGATSQVSASAVRGDLPVAESSRAALHEGILSSESSTMMVNASARNGCAENAPTKKRTHTFTESDSTDDSSRKRQRTQPSPANPTLEFCDDSAASPDLLSLDFSFPANATIGFDSGLDSFEVGQFDWAQWDFDTFESMSSASAFEYDLSKLALLVSFVITI
jgi:hypothetical protein